MAAYTAANNNFDARRVLGHLLAAYTAANLCRVEIPSGLLLLAAYTAANAISDAGNKN